MTTIAATHTSLTPMVLETVVAAALVALVVALGLAAVYALVAGAGAWLLMLLIGVLRLLWLPVRGAGRAARAHLHRTHARVRDIAPESVPGPRVRPLG